MIKIKTNKLTGGAICASLCVIMIFLACVVPNIKLAFLFAASLVVGICILKYRLASALMCYIVVSFISILIIPDKMYALAFVVLFGNYPIIKLYIEKLKNIVIEYVLKFLVSNVYLFMAYIVLKALEKQAYFDFTIYAFYIVGIIALLLYDLVFGFVINAFYKSYYKYLK